MRICPVMRISNNNTISKYMNNNAGRFIRKVAVGAAFCTSTLFPASCVIECVEPQQNNNNDKIENVTKIDDKILPDTVSQVQLQDINDIHEKINTLFQSLKIIPQDKNIQDIKTIEFKDIEGNLYRYTDIHKITDGYEFVGTVNSNGTEISTFMRFTDAYKKIQRPLICLETSFNKKHNLSMLYQTRWRLGEDKKPERRIFQNRINKYVEFIDPKEYYPYDFYNIFAIRKTEDGITSKAFNDERPFTKDDEIKQIQVTYK